MLASRVTRFSTYPRVAAQVVYKLSELPGVFVIESPTPMQFPPQTKKIVGYCHKES